MAASDSVLSGIPESDPVTSRILIVQDPGCVSGPVSCHLQNEGYLCLTVDNGQSVETTWKQWHPNVVILMVRLPDVPGLAVLRQRRREGDDTPVIVLSFSGQEDNRVLGLEAGADDYMVQPVSLRELNLRVRGLLRRAQGFGELSLPRSIKRGDLVIDVERRIFCRGNTQIILTPRECDLVTYLAFHSGRAFTKHQLMRRVWGWDFGGTATVTVHVRRVREKIEHRPSQPELLLTVRGVGYRFDDNIATSSLHR